MAGKRYIAACHFLLFYSANVKLDGFVDTAFFIWSSDGNAGCAVFTFAGNRPGAGK